MQTITIPKKLMIQDDLVIIPRKEYETLLVFKRWKEFIPTVKQKRALAKAEQNFQQKKTLSYHALTKELGITH